ncbi:DEAD/DEAH box helicase [Amylibacter ulvae]|uniref:DEAD/DEAH box helicase n=1 Tax=Paramylibacter ulvae TaxID=1651968 RepID=A0ABQ3D384_9RHOB|nr:DEAD/DEAH box helicase [Amylibacter ulvae]GHA53544.1 DEAD/DEAH box helicase [Amylibacter ulvae]
MTKFIDLGLSPKVLKAIADVGYDTPTPIQAEAIPPALEGRDVLGIAQTGTGKTAGFTLPMIHKLARGRARARMPRSLVLAPTRELAAQVAENFELYAKYVKLDMALLIGGVSFNEQDKLIDRGVDVLIATPGRLLDHFERGKLLLTGIEIMVVDEADRMLDMGFIPDIERIFKLTPFTRQTLFFSATMAPEITRITQEFLQNPTRIEVARQATTSENIEQKVCCFKAPNRKVEAKVKRDTLRAIIESQSETLTNGIIFCNRKVDVDIVLKSLKKHGYNAGAIHGDLDQRYRMEVLNGFRNNDIQLLVASDVAARGLDIPNVSHVFNYDVPIHSEDYVHRIGRTGRAGRSGWAFMLCLPHEQKHLDKIEELVKQPIPRIDAPIAETPKSTRAPKADKPKHDQKEKPQRAKPQQAKPAADKTDKQDKAPAKQQPEKNDQNNRQKQPRNHKQEPKNTVKGMGDHMPAFMTQSFDFVKKDPAPQNVSDEDTDTNDDA